MYPDHRITRTGCWIRDSFMTQIAAAVEYRGFHRIFQMQRAGLRGMAGLFIDRAGKRADAVDAALHPVLRGAYVL